MAKVDNDVLENKVSVCTNFIPKAGWQRPLFLMLTSISEKNRDLIRRLRAGENVKNLLESYTPSGVFPGEREMRALTSENFSGVFQIDIDGKTNKQVTDWPGMRSAIVRLPWVAAAGLSCGGGGLFVLGRVLDMANCEQASKEAGWLLEEAFGLTVDKAVKNRASLRFVTLPEETEINHNPVPFEVQGLESKRPQQPPIPIDHGSSIPLALSRVGPIGSWHYNELSNYISISVNHGIKPRAVIAALEAEWEVLFATSSEAGPVQSVPRMVKKYYDKYAGERFGIERSTNALDYFATEDPQPEPEIRYNDPPKTYIDPELQAEVMELCALSPFVPMKLYWYDKAGNVCTSMILVGPPESGKGVINTLIKPLRPFNDYIAKERKGEEEEGGEGKKKKKKVLNHIQPITGFESSDAAIQGSLGRFKAMVMTATEIDTAVTSMGKEYNSGRSALLRKLTEGEDIDKILKNTGDGNVSKIEINEPRFAMIIGGTPGSVDRFIGSNIENGFSSRAFVIEIPPSDWDTPRVVKVRDLSKLLTPHEMQTYGDYRLDQCGEVRFDYEYAKSIGKRLEEEYGKMPGIARGVRNCVRLAAVKVWLRDRTVGSVRVKNDEIEHFVPVLKQTLDYIEEISQVKRDGQGRDITQQEVNKNKAVYNGKAIRVGKEGEAVSADNIKWMQEVYKDYNGNARATAKATGFNRRTVDKYCKTKK